MVMTLDAALIALTVIGLLLVIVGAFTFAPLMYGGMILAVWCFAAALMRWLDGYKERTK